MTHHLKAGDRFGRLILRQKCRYAPKESPNLRIKWVCDCECGNRVTVPQYYLLRRPNPKVDCGACEDQKSLQARFPDLYSIHYMMLRRCYDETHVGYKYYGKRGIKVCDEWKDKEKGFINFVSSVGERPSPSHTIDRYPNPDGNYEPNNVRWATPKQQAQNKSKLYGKS